MATLESSAQIEALLAQYHLLGEIAMSDEGFTTWHYDNQGNQLKVTVQKGELIQYEETPVAERKVLVWNDESARYEYKRQNAG